MERILILFILERGIDMFLLKLLLFASIFISSSTMGHLYGQRFSTRLENLIFLEQCIKILETEIIYGATPLPEALNDTFNKGNMKVSYIFRYIKEDLILNKRDSVYESFLAIENCLYEEIHLKKEDVEIFLSLGRVLGTSDRLDQQKNFVMVLNQINAKVLDAKIDKEKNEKLYKTLGVIGGLGIIILLV